MRFKSICLAGLPLILPVILTVIFTAALPISPQAANMPDVYTMEEAVLRALKANPSLESATYAVDVMESGRRAALSSFGPTIASSYSVTRYDHERQMRNEKNLVTLAVQAQQPLFTGFNLLNSYQKAALQVENQKLQMQQAKLRIIGQVQEQFLAYLTAEETLRSTQRSMERAKAQMETAEAAHRVGLRPRQDLLQAEVDYTNSEARMIQSETALNLGRAQLNTLLNLPVDSQTTFVGNLDAKPFDRSLEASLDTAHLSRPDLLMAQKALEIAYKDQGIARSAFYPQVNAILTWSTTGNTWRAAGSNLLPAQRNYRQGTAGLQVQWGIFTSGRRYHINQQARSQISALEAQLQSVYNMSAYEIRAYLLSLQDANRMIAVAEHQVASAMEAYKNASLSYELQSATYLDVLTAQSSLANAELSHITTKSEYLKLLSKLYIAMGEINPALR